MGIQLRYHFLTITCVLFVLAACKGSENKTEPAISTVNFFDKKYDSDYSLIIDESNISDYPQMSYLDCDKTGYFTIYFVPKKPDLINYWKGYYNDADFETLNIDESNKQITSIVKNNWNNYYKFCYYVPSSFIDKSNGCTIESLNLTNDTKATIYLFKNNNWIELKTIESTILPPYLESSFFLDILQDKE